MPEFFGFLDDLNTTYTADPSLQTLNTASKFVPLLQIPGGHLISKGIQAGSKMGQAHITKSKGEHFLEEANAAYLGPRGLVVG